MPGYDELDGGAPPAGLSDAAAQAMQAQATQQPMPQVPPQAPAAPPPPPPRGVPFPGEASEGGNPLAGLVSPRLAVMPGGSSPAHWQPTTQDVKRTEKEGPYSPQAQQAMLDALGARGDVAQAQIAAGAAQSAATQKNAALVEDVDRQNLERKAARMASQQAMLGDYQQKIARVNQEAADMRVDPGHYFHSMSSGQQILTMLGMVVGGFAHGYTGRGSDPMQWINARIKDDIDAQKDAIDSKKQQAISMGNEYARMRQQFGDDESARDALEYKQRQWMVNHLERVAADQTAPAMNRLNAANIVAGLKKDQAETLERLDDRTLSNIERHGAERFVPAQSGGQSLGVQVMTADGRKVTVPLAQAKELGLLPAQQAELMKTLAETQKLGAEANKAAGKGDTAQFDIAAQRALGSSTSLMSEPGKFFSQHFQGTEGQQARLDREAWNSFVLGQIHKMVPIKQKEQLEELARPYTILQNDKPETIQRRVAEARAFLAGQQPVNVPGFEE